MAVTTLTLPEQILLLVLKDREGSLLQATHFRFTLAGAILTELLLQGRIELDIGTSGPLVTVVDKTPTGDPALDDALDELRTATRRTSPERWIGRFAQHEELHLQVARQLCRKGALKEHEGRVRLVFRRTVYVDLEPEIEARVTDRVRDAVFGDGEVEHRTALVIALARAGDILRAVFGAEEVLERSDRIVGVLEHVTTDDPSSEGFQEAERALVTATEVAVMEGSGAAA